MDTEVLVYIQKVKTYLQANEEANDYFIGKADVDEFYKQLTISQTRTTKRTVHQNYLKNNLNY